MTVTPTDLSEIPDPRILAVVDLLRRAGMAQFQLRYSDDEDPTVWIGVAEWKVKKGKKRKASESYWFTGCGLNPVRALLNLAAEAIDGGTCTHCKRPTGVDDSWGDLPMDDLICWYQFDPELNTFRRGCEGD